ncbi:MAG: PKD domain-containing protein [Bacteroidia bacterium]|nr:PKD domain-containing protein [Bacteroidia bacterium]
MFRRAAVIGLALLGLGIDAYASHYLGGDLTYICLGPGPGGTTRYRVRFTLYRDCNGIPADAQITISWRSIQCNVSGSRLVSRSTIIPGSGADVTPVCSGSSTRCAGPGPVYGIERWIYETIVDLPAGCGNDWIFWHDNCCRSAAIDNLSGSGGQGSTFYVTLDNTLTPCNSSPQFTNLPQFFNCINRPTLLNLGLMDPDGDSLVISLTNCLNSGAVNPPPFPSANYAGSYSGLNPFPTSTGILIQPGGLFSYIATTIFQAAFCYKVEEYRNGVKIGETIQDVYLIIQNCPASTPPGATTSAPGRPSVGYDETNANSFTFTAPVCPGQAGQQYCITFRYQDNANPPPQNQLRVTVVQVPTGATTVVTGNNTNNAQVQLCWTPTFADIGDHIVVITVENNACPIRGRWDYTYVLRVRPALSYNGHIAVIRSPGDTVPTRDTTVCVGTQLRLRLTARDSVPNAGDIASVQWSTTGGLTAPPSFPPNPLTQAVSPLVTVTGPGQYIATVTFRGGCVDRDTLRVNIFPPDTVRINEPIRLCAGDTISLTATSVLSLPIQWYTGVPLTGTLLGTGSPLSYTAVLPGTSPIYAVTQDANGCVSIDTAQITVERGPDFTATATPATCRGLNNGTITLTPNLPGSYNFTLYDAGGGVVAGPQATGSFSNLAPGVYIAAVQGPAPNPCFSYDTLVVSQGDSVSLLLLGDSIRYGCVPFQASFQATASTTLNAPLSYIWNFGDGNTTVTATPSASHTYTSAGVYVVVVRATTPQGCFATDTLVVNTLNPLGLDAQPGRVCKEATSGTVTLVVQAAGIPPITYQALPIPSGAGPSFGPQSNPTFTIPVGVRYEFIAQDSVGCQGRDTLLLVPTDSVEGISLTNGAIPTCYPVGVEFTAQAQGTGSFTYYWDFGNGSRDTTSTPTATGFYTAGGNYIVVVIIRNEIGCADTLLTPVFIPATGERIDAQVLAASPVSGCPPLTVNFEGAGSSSIGTALAFRWEFGDGNSAVGTQATHTYSQPGRYTAVFYAQNPSSPQCYDTAQVVVWVDGFPTAQIQAPPQPSSIGYYVASPIAFTAAPGPYNVRFYWRADSQVAGTGPTYTISYIQKGTFCVYLTVESELGCLDSTSYCFDVSGYMLLIPNAFTPNGDGVNDLLNVVGYGMEFIEAAIYDRWGRLIYTGRGSERVSWDGTRGGQPVPEGVYTYVVRYKLIDKSEVEYRTGTVTLLR